MQEIYRHGEKIPGGGIMEDIPEKMFFTGGPGQAKKTTMAGYPSGGYSRSPQHLNRFYKAERLFGNFDKLIVFFHPAAIQAAVDDLPAKGVKFILAEISQVFFEEFVD